MPVVPASPTAKIEWYEAHNPVWATVATQVGLTTTEVTALTTKTTAARAALAAQIAAYEAAKAATQNLKNLVEVMASAGSDAIKKIRAAAAVNANVYVLAQIPAPANPSPVPAPGTPTNFTIELQQNGSLVVRWKCSNPRGASGTIYQVSRQIGQSGTMTLLGATGLKKFVDTTLPAGIVTPVTYQVQAMRSTTSGAPAEFTVKFGVGGAGQMTASVMSAPRMAA